MTALEKAHAQMLEDGCPTEALRKPPAPNAIEHLRKHQRQLDHDGLDVGVSRQALNEVLDAVERPVRPIDNFRLEREIAADLQLRRDIAMLVDAVAGGDEQTTQDTYEGESTLDDTINRALAQEAEDLIHLTGLNALIEQFTARRDRFKKRIEARTGIIEKAMISAGRKSLDTLYARLTIVLNRPHVVVDEESDIPSQFFKPADPTLDKAGIRGVLLERAKMLTAAKAIADDALRAGELRRIDLEYPALPGCHLEAHESLQIRRK